MVNHRVVNQVHVIAGVSGGVHVDPWRSVTAEAIQVDNAVLPNEHRYGTPQTLPNSAWWWD